MNWRLFSGPRLSRIPQHTGPLPLDPLVRSQVLLRGPSQTGLIGEFLMQRSNQLVNTDALRRPLAARAPVASRRLHAR